MSENKTDGSPLREQFMDIFGGRTQEEARAMLTAFQKLMSYYRCAMMEVETKFRVLNEEFSLQHD